MSTVSFLVRLKHPTRKKHISWLKQQKEYSSCVNDCVHRIQSGESLTSKNVYHNLKSAIKNEAIRRAKKAISDFKKGLAKQIPTFKATMPISINNQNWDTRFDNGGWKIGFTTNEGKVYLPVMESEQVKAYFPFLTKEQRDFRGTIQLLRKGTDWYVAIPIEISCSIEVGQLTKQTAIGVDLGLRHIAVVSEPISGKRQFFSGKEVGYIRRHFRSLRRSLGKKKALRAVKSVGQKERRWMTDYNRKLAKDIVDFAMQFEHPIIKMEKLDDIRKRCKTLSRADRTIHSWAFYQLKKFVRERAAKCGIMVVDVNPYQTSQRCYTCGIADKQNRIKEKFACVNCGNRDHADHNASKNISTSLAV